MIYIQRKNKEFRFSFNEFNFIPYVKNDGYRGFIKFLFLAFNWYPIGK